jgi:segregation and condensation protein B
MSEGRHEHSDQRSKPPWQAQQDRRQYTELSTATAKDSGSPLSLNRLRAAFAQMLGAEQVEPAPPTARDRRAQCSAPARRKATAAIVSAVDPCEISPRTVVEAMLFVGRADNRPFPARELAAAMRGVSPAEIEAAVTELNHVYQRDAAPYQITSSAQGYRLELHAEFARLRDKLQGRYREAKLSPVAMEVLSIVAYHQPTTAQAINELRGASSGASLAWLVRRRLLRIDRPAEGGAPPSYSTTNRFLRLFGLETIAALPRSDELDKS